MITGFILNILYVVAFYVVSLLPVSEFPEIVTTGWMYFWGVMNSLSFLFPVYDLAAILVIWALLMKTGLGLFIIRRLLKGTIGRAI